MSVTWRFFGYGLGWYGKKFLYICIHVIIGCAVSLPAWAILTFTPSVDVWYYLKHWGIVLRVFLAIMPLIVGGCIEWTQNDKTGKKWIDRKVWLLGSARDVLSYALFSWVVFI